MSATAPQMVREIIELMRGGAWLEALQRIERALMLQPLEPRYLIYRAQCLMALRR